MKIQWLKSKSHLKQRKKQRNKYPTPQLDSAAARLVTTNGAGTRLYTSGSKEALQTLESTNICTSELIGSKQ